MKASKVISILNRLAPPFLIDSWDNSGLQIGSTEKQVEKILVSLDLSENTLKKAIEQKADMIITHHPFIFSKLNNIYLDDEKGKMIRDIIKNDITVFSMHTNLDMCDGGVNDTLCEMLEINKEKPLSKFVADKLYKVVVFVPRDYSEQVRGALGDSGAGFIGNYSHCTFSSNGTGRFLPTEHTNPFIGTTNELEAVDEEKIETIVDEHKLQTVISSMIKAHPYEEVAYDIYPLNNKGNLYGYGRVGDLNIATTLKDFSKVVNEKLECSDLRIYGELDKTIKKVAVCGGSGASFIKNAHTANADVYITGDIKYHDAQLAKELGVALLDAGHFETEKPAIYSLEKYLNEHTDLDISTYEESVGNFTTIQ